MKTNSIMMGVLVAVIAVMGVAFAAFSTTLTIEGTASISSNWKIDYTPGECTETANPYDTYEDTSGNVSVTDGIVKIAASMASPGDELTCTVTVTNNSTGLSAVRKGWTWSNELNNDDYEVEFSAPNAAELKPGDSETLTFIIKYKDKDVNVKPEGTATFTGVATYGQYGITDTK